MCNFIKHLESNVFIYKALFCDFWLHFAHVDTNNLYEQYA